MVTDLCDNCSHLQSCGKICVSGSSNQRNVLPCWRPKKTSRCLRCKSTICACTSPTSLSFVFLATSSHKSQCIAFARISVWVHVSACLQDVSVVQAPLHQFLFECMWICACEKKRVCLCESAFMFFVCMRNQLVWLSGFQSHVVSCLSQRNKLCQWELQWVSQ